MFVSNDKMYNSMYDKVYNSMYDRGYNSMYDRVYNSIYISVIFVSSVKYCWSLSIAFVVDSIKYSWEFIVLFFNRLLIIGLEHSYINGLIWPVSGSVFSLCYAVLFLCRISLLL